MSERKQKRWVRDYEVEAATGGVLTKSRLQKDRLGKQLFPFHRVGRDCFYDLDEVNEVIVASRCGGKVRKQAA
jgi:hypothetical protein